MKFTCNQQTLTKALNIVSKAVTSRTTIPILRGILLSIDSEGYLKLSASDLDISIEKKIKTKNSEEGSIVVQAKLFSDIIRKLPENDIIVEEINENISISCVGSQFNIVGLPADEFPNINITEEKTEELIFNKEIIKEMIKKTSFSASIDEARGIITGTLIEILPETVNMVSLDGFRMAIAREKIQSNNQKSIVISAKILSEIGKIIVESEYDNEDVSFIIGEKKAIVKMEDTTVIVRLLEGDFIKYTDILPKESKCRVVLNKSDFLDSIERASLLAKVGKNNLIKLEIKENTMEITSKSEEGNVKENVIISKEGEDITIGFNSKYLIDSLKVIDDEEVSMLFNTSISPCLIKPLSGDKYEYLILPVRITNN